MEELRRLISRHCDVVGEEDPQIQERKLLGKRLPAPYWSVLRTANGFATRRGYFRLFPLQSFTGLPSVEEWNELPWKREYGSLLGELVIVAEDVFGDQYAFAGDDDKPSILVKMSCEGGRVQPLETQNLITFLAECVLHDAPTAFDFDLAEAAFRIGLRPDIGQHLAFSLPLVSGGECILTNLGVESVSLHMGLLGQMSLRNQSLSDGSKISRFRDSGSESGRA